MTNTGSEKKMPTGMRNCRRCGGAVRRDIQTLELKCLMCGRTPMQGA